MIYWSGPLDKSVMFLQACIFNGGYSPDAKWPYPAKACFGIIMNFYD